MSNFDFSVIDKTWTLFLDRDGVINVRKMNEYVLNKEEFIFIEGYHEAIRTLSARFGRIVVVTNQQGVGKGLMTEKDLEEIHAYLRSETQKAGGRIDAIYFAPQLKTEDQYYRKPGIGMALAAKKDFPEIDFSKSVMVGDTDTDIAFGENAGMKTVYISAHNDLQHPCWFERLVEFGLGLGRI